MLKMLKSTVRNSQTTSGVLLLASRSIFSIFFIVLAIGCGHLSNSKSGYHVIDRENKSATLAKPYVILVSIDAYRHDYTDKYKPKNLLKFRNRGSFATSLRPTFPSKTFPNHYSIVTGLHAGRHGIVANKFYSRPLKTLYKLSNRTAVVDGRFYGGTPLWVAAEKQGMLSASYFWPGSEAEIKGYRPTYYYTYKHATPHEERVNQVLDWLKLPESKRPHFMALYFSDVDSAGHHYGTQSKELEAAVHKVDRAIGSLMSGLEKLSLPVNVVIVSDHGMTNVDKKKVEYLDSFLSKKDFKGVRVVGNGPQIFLYCDSKKKEGKVYRKLKFDALGAHFQVFRKAELPKKFQYSKHSHVGDIIVMAKPPYTVCQSPGCRFSPGVHGYDPYKYRSMHGIFYAFGPSFKRGKRVQTTNNVDVYPTILKALKLDDKAPHDGSLKRLGPLLK